MTFLSPSSKHGKRGRAGFTLVEVTVAASLTKKLRAELGIAP